MTFSDAIAALDDDKLVCRSGWNGKNMFLIKIMGWLPTRALGIQEYEPVPFYALKTPDHKLVPWNASQLDATATDWELVS